MSIPIPTIKRVDNITSTPSTPTRVPTLGNRQPKPTRVPLRWHNTKVVRSDGRNEGYHYRDWRGEFGG